ncbi:MAG: cytochrome C, partial [Nitrosomonadaceae bacterium]|nr:cytochrome C [Nitrosomonadaceae bacterium]
NPTVTDLWNTTPTWGFPWSSSPLAPTQSAANLIESLGSQVIGATAYMMLNDMLYIEAGGYTSLPKNAQKGISVFDAEQARLSGGAPYWRIALQKDWSGHYGAVGAYGLHGDVNPQRITGAGTDRYDDFGFDLTYQYLANPVHIYEFTATYLRENRNMNASSALGFADKLKSNLDTVRIRTGYTFQQTYGLNLFYNQTTGTADTVIYSFGDPISGSRTGNPLSQAFIAEISYTPFGKTNTSVMSTFVNLRLAAQYVHNFKFNGSVHNYDGLGRNAVNNDAFYLNGWLAF